MTRSELKKAFLIHREMMRGDAELYGTVPVIVSKFDPKKKPLTSEEMYEKYKDAPFLEQNQWSDERYVIKTIKEMVKDCGFDPRNVYPQILSDTYLEINGEEIDLNGETGSDAVKKEIEYLVKMINKYCNIEI